MDEAEENRPVPRSRLSKTPSWIMMGFILGALCVLSFPREKAAKPKPPPEPPPVKLERPALTNIEAVFAGWGHYAVWKNDLTEVALWDTEKRSFTIFYEVLRNGENYYFRSIPRLTRPVLTHGVHVDSPILFTETEESRREWLERDRAESIRPPLEYESAALVAERNKRAAEEAAAEHALTERAAADAAARRKSP